MSVSAAPLAVRAERLADQLAAAQEGAHPRDQFFHREWLGEIVVGAHLQPGDLIRHVVARRQHEHRRGGGATQLAQDLQPIQLRQHPVEDDGVRQRARVDFQRAQPIGGLLCSESRRLQLAHDQRGEFSGVFHDQDGRRRLVHDG